MSESDLNEIENMPKGGPLKHYRDKASFDWKKMKLFFEDAELVKFKKHVWNTLKSDPLFTIANRLPTDQYSKRAIL